VPRRPHTNPRGGDEDFTAPPAARADLWLRLSHLGVTDCCPASAPRQLSKLCAVFRRCLCSQSPLVGLRA